MASLKGSFFEKIGVFIVLQYTTENGIEEISNRLGSY